MVYHFAAVFAASCQGSLGSAFASFPELVDKQRSNFISNRFYFILFQKKNYLKSRSLHVLHFDLYFKEDENVCREGMGPLLVILLAPKE